jgi:hypothetical protein
MLALLVVRNTGTVAALAHWLQHSGQTLKKGDINTLPPNRTLLLHTTLFNSTPLHHTTLHYIAATTTATTVTHRFAEDAQRELALPSPLQRCRHYVVGPARVQQQPPLRDLPLCLCRCKGCASAVCKQVLRSALPDAGRDRGAPRAQYVKPYWVVVFEVGGAAAVLWGYSCSCSSSGSSSIDSVSDGSGSSAQ